MFPRVDQTKHESDDMKPKKRKRATTPKQPATNEPIRPGESLRLSDFLMRVDLGKAAWRKVRDRCEELQINIVTYANGQGYVSTDGWLDYLSRVGERKHTSTANRRKPVGAN